VAKKRRERPGRHASIRSEVRQVKKKKRVSYKSYTLQGAAAARGRPSKTSGFDFGTRLTTGEHKKPKKIRGVGRENRSLYARRTHHSKERLTGAAAHPLRRLRKSAHQEGLERGKWGGRARRPGTATRRKAKRNPRDREQKQIPQEGPSSTPTIRE